MDEQNKTSTGWLATKIGRGYRAVFLISFCVSLLAMAVVFMKDQAESIHKILSGDFRVLVIMEGNVSPQDQAENILRVTDGVAATASVSKADSLELVKSRDPELAKSISVVGENPMPEFFEIRVKDSVLYDIGAWLQNNILNGKVPGAAGVFYKPEQVYALQQLSFYRLFLYMVLGLFFVGFATFALYCEVLGARKISFAVAFPQGIGKMVSGFAGAAAALGIFWLLIYPIKYLSPIWWSAPLIKWEAAIILEGALLGWALFRCE
ncbi:MAG: hypothetical protein NTW04_03525 [Elusimicrobia bacterium]|nr:hypothetical protein [Elusimicrobiota bacterium]